MLAAVILVCAAAVLPAVTSAKDPAQEAPSVTHETAADIAQPLTPKDAAPYIGASEIMLNTDTTPDEPVAELPDGTEAPKEAGTDPDDPVAEPFTNNPATPNEGTTPTPSEEPEELGAVHTITRTTPDENAIGLQWNTAAGAQGYHVYWHDADNKDGSYSLLASLKDTSITIRNLKKGAMYCFKVAAYRAEEGTLTDGEAAELTASTMPVGVTDFRLASCAATGTVLKWDKNSLCDGYVLYREFSGVWSRYQVLPRDTAEFCDTDVIPGRAYNYRIATYRTDSSGTVESADVLLRTVSGLDAPSDNGTKNLLRRMYFKWKKNPYANGYEVQYSFDKKNFTVMTDTAATSYTTDKLTEGKHYYFRICPYRYVKVGSEKVKVYGTYLAKDLTVTNSAYGKTVPNTYIEVSIEQQHMWYYIDGKLYVSTDVVTGNYNSMDTPKGYWSVNSKVSPCTLIGEDYVSYVDYWIAFIGGGYGIHDASWRSKFGGTIYKGDGSHGCVNTPYDAVKKIYAKVTIGTPVIIY